MLYIGTHLSNSNQPKDGSKKYNYEICIKSHSKFVIIQKVTRWGIAEKNLALESNT